ncbi:MAG TPA: PAS domain-containing protein [Candidatus Hydrogenedentes bacterium]|nr:PAS domain-containing protein [Candidatus Hydrogenedentota bacterium]
MIRPVVLILHAVAAERDRLANLAERHCPKARLVAAPSVAKAISALAKAFPSVAVVGAPAYDQALRLARSLRKRFPDDPFPMLLLLPENTSPEALDAQAWSLLDAALPAGASDAFVAARLQGLLQRRKHIDELRAANKRLASLASDRSVTLRDCEDRYRMLFNTASDPVVVFEISTQPLAPGRIIEANEEVCRVLGYDNEKLTGMSIMDILHPERADAATVRMESLLKHHQVFFETVLVTKAGRPLPIAVTARAFLSDDRYLVLAVGRLQRIGSGAASTSEGDSRYEIVADRTGQILYDYNIPANSIRWIGAVTRVTGYAREEIDGADFQRLLEMIHPDDRDRVRGAIQRGVAEIGVYHSEYRFLHKSGTYRYFEDEGLALPGEDGRAYRVLGAVRDVTARALAERERRRFELEAQHSQRLESLGVLAGGIAHDFNNVLAAIIGLTDMALQDIPADSPTHADLSEALQAAHRAKELVKQILAFSRQTGEDRGPLYLHVVVREAMKLARATLPATIEIIDDVDVHSGVVEANAGQIHQVLMNFITNSAQAIGDRGGRISVTLRDVDVDEHLAATHPKLRPGPYVRLSVTDNGHGMEQRILKRVFDPFFTTKGPGEGTGMGLSVVHGIITSHNGAVMAESASGQGATFHTYLPRVVSPVLEDQLVRHAQPRAQGRILFVDDEEAVRRFGKAALEKLGYDVAAVDSADSALQAFESDEAGFDLIITDQVMPRMTGADLVEELRRRGSKVPVILFTGFGEHLTEAKAARAGIQEIVTKPVVAHELDAVIRRILATEPSDDRPGARRSN